MFLSFRVEADLGRFSESIYKKVTADAKRERFQGFRPGTIPPHLQSTYRAFAMDECARETVLEAMQQNNIRPFDNTRTELTLSNFVIPPPPSKKKKKKKKRKKGEELNLDNTVVEEEPKWRTFPEMKGAIDAGWKVSLNRCGFLVREEQFLLAWLMLVSCRYLSKPGQSFSFIAKNVRGQKVKSDDEVRGASPLGLDY